MLAFGVFWSCRLSFNYWRKGGYNKGSEDYRWEILREKIPGPLFFIFNILFISLTQSVSRSFHLISRSVLIRAQVLLFSVATPAYVLLLVSKVTGEELYLADWVVTSILISLVAFEFVADGAQWSEYIHSIIQFARADMVNRLLRS